jgi:hypothetical protein
MAAGTLVAGAVTAYSSTREPAFERALEQAQRLAKRLAPGWNAFECEEVPPKPKRM